MSRLAVLVAVTSLGALAVIAAAAAGRPTHSSETFDNMFTIPAAPAGPCAYAIQGHATGTVKTKEFFDTAGNLTREISAFPMARVTFSANGKSISTVTPSVERITF